MRKCFSWLILGLLLLLILSACSRIDPQGIPTKPLEITQTFPEPTSTAAPMATNTLSYGDIRPRSWHEFGYYDWNHDGYPYESDNFIVYSDYSAMSTKQRFAQEAEYALERILPVFDIPEKDEHVRIIFPKFEVFISSFRQEEVLWQGTSHYGGFLLVFNKEYYRQAIFRFPDNFPYAYLVTHELTHVICYRILRYTELDPTRLPHAWFDEGLATYLGVPPLPIRTLQLYEIAIRNVAHFPEQGNPINIRYPILVPYDYPYDLYELAVYYLIETYGMENVISILYDMRNNYTFEEAFENRLGMTVDEYQ